MTIEQFEWLRRDLAEGRTLQTCGKCGEPGAMFCVMGACRSGLASTQKSRSLTGIARSYPSLFR